MSEYMNNLYKSSPDSQRIIIDNYSISSNILAINKQLLEKVTISKYQLGALLSDNDDVILIESFGYNPLSDLGLENGIKRQNEALKELVERLIKEKPNMSIIFVATIAPNVNNYGRSTQQATTASDRRKQAEERIAYIKTISNLRRLTIYL